jgi:hypothetical protein
MTLVSITAGDPCRVRIYECAPGSLLRNRLIDVKLNRSPDRSEAADMQKRPQGFVHRITPEPEAA